MKVFYSNAQEGACHNWENEETVISKIKNFLFRKEKRFMNSFAIRVEDKIYVAYYKCCNKLSDAILDWHYVSVFLGRSRVLNLCCQIHR